MWRRMTGDIFILWPLFVSLFHSFCHALAIYDTNLSAIVHVYMWVCVCLSVLVFLNWFPFVFVELMDFKLDSECMPCLQWVSYRWNTFPYLHIQMKMNDFIVSAYVFIHILTRPNMSYGTWYSFLNHLRILRIFTVHGWQMLQQQQIRLRRRQRAKNVSLSLLRSHTGVRLVLHAAHTHAHTHTIRVCWY